MKQLQKLQVKALPVGSGVSVLYIKTVQLIVWLVPHIHKIMPTYYAVIMLDALHTYMLNIM